MDRRVLLVSVLDRSEDESADYSYGLGVALFSHESSSIAYRRLPTASAVLPIRAEKLFSVKGPSERTRMMIPARLLVGS